ncbi:MAG: hypothetical protein LBR40_06065 [Bacilli bacterium]|nr:hypothetical protein [Bacilli bacterium]
MNNRSNCFYCYCGFYAFNYSIVASFKIWSNNKSRWS